MDPSWAQRIVTESRNRIAQADDRATRMREAFEQGKWEEYSKEVAAEYGIDATGDNDIDIGEHAERRDDAESPRRSGGESGAELPQAGGGIEPSPGGGDARRPAAALDDEPS